jgi:hypothetical protein
VYVKVLAAHGTGDQPTTLRSSVLRTTSAQYAEQAAKSAGRVSEVVMCNVNRFRINENASYAYSTQ